MKEAGKQLVKKSQMCFTDEGDVRGFFKMVLRLGAEPACITIRRVKLDVCFAALCLAFYALITLSHRSFCR